MVLKKLYHTFEMQRRYPFYVFEFLKFSAVIQLSNILLNYFMGASGKDFS